MYLATSVAGVIKATTSVSITHGSARADTDSCHHDVVRIAPHFDADADTAIATWDAVSAHIDDWMHDLSDHEIETLFDDFRFDCHWTRE